MDKKPRGLDSELARRAMKQMARLNVALYRRTGGRVGGTWRVGAALRRPAKICLLEHRGRRTGRRLTTPLLFMRDAERVVVVASQAGRAQDPQWYLNAVADPEVTVQIGRSRQRMTARPATEEEREQLWPRLLEVYADYASYQSWTDRLIPVVILEPRPVVPG
jgi:deazaflavin-dependent oxidoreductase (nitroreductase family)